jgi:plastocyanin
VAARRAEPYNFSFTPQELTVQPGTTVTWVNQDDVPHTVVSTDNKFKSKALDTDDKFSFKSPS